MQKEYWHNKRILVTGAGGFVGTHLVQTLHSLGVKVMPIIRKNGKYDISDRQMLESFFEKKPDVIYHLAGESLVEKGQSAPYDTFRTNFIGTLNVLELSRIYRISRVVIASTAHVYGEGQPPFHEDDPPRPSRPYETSKTTTDLLAQSYADSFNLGVVIGRFANIYGPGDTNFTRLIPKILRFALQKKPVPIWGGEAKREYLYIDDAIEAYLMLGTISDAQLERNRIFNFGVGSPVAVRDMINTIGKLIGEKIEIVKIPKDREGEITDQYVSWEKANRMLGWKPKVFLDEGLSRAIAWYRDYLYTTNL